MNPNVLNVVTMVYYYFTYMCTLCSTQLHNIQNTADNSIYKKGIYSLYYAQIIFEDCFAPSQNKV